MPIEVTLEGIVICVCDEQFWDAYSPISFINDGCSNDFRFESDTNITVDFFVFIKTRTGYWFNSHVDDDLDLRWIRLFHICNVLEKSPDGYSISILASDKLLICDAISDELRIFFLHMNSVINERIKTFWFDFDALLGPAVGTVKSMHLKYCLYVSLR